MTTDTTNRKKRLEDRLSTHGIRGYPIDHLPYLEFDDTNFATPYQAGCRMIILYAVAYTATEPNNREKISNWLKKENLWIHVSPNERELFEGKVQDQQKLDDFSWEGESAYILAWALNIIKEIPTLTEEVNEKQFDNFMDNVPALGEPLEKFLTNLNFRDTTEIYDENLFHELVTTYYRDLMFNGKEDESNIDAYVSFLRHKTLNWLRRFMNIEEWDETDTST